MATWSKQLEEDERIARELAVQDLLDADMSIISISDDSSSSGNSSTVVQTSRMQQLWDDMKLAKELQDEEMNGASRGSSPEVLFESQRDRDKPGTSSRIESKKIYPEFDFISHYEDNLYDDEEKAQAEKDYQLALAIMKEEQEAESLRVANDLAAGDAHQIPPDDINMKYKSVVDPELELKDPNPDLWHLFRCFDKRFFHNILTENGVEVNWSSRMTMCAGVCGYKSCGHSAGCVSIRLSKPLLQLRPRKDLVETLLHEMIHALLFVQKINDNHESHGKVFHEHMHRISSEGKCHITVYHNFHDEVKHYQNHVWKCNGVCRNYPPYYGVVRRAMNRAPGPNDFWFSQHQETCGGTFVKIEGPEKVKSVSKSKKESKVISGGIKSFLTPKDGKKPIDGKASKPVAGTKRTGDPLTSDTKSHTSDSSEPKAKSSASGFKPFSGDGRKLSDP